MKAHRTGWTVLLATALALASPAARAAPVELTLIHVNDTHSHLAAWGPKNLALQGTIGGLPRAAARIAAISAAEPNPFLVHAGDLFHGDFMFNHFYGIPEFLALNQLGLVAMVPGNHEFDAGFGAPFLAFSLGYTADPDTAASLGFEGGEFMVPLVGTNYEPASLTEAQLDAWIQPYRIVERGGVRIGFIGLTIPDDLGADPSPVVLDGYDVAFQKAQAAVTLLREQEHVDLVVALAHVGLSRSQELAKKVSGIDVIVSGHDHEALTTPIRVGQTAIVCAGSFYRYVGHLKIIVDPVHHVVRFGRYDLESLDITVAPDPTFQALIAGLESKVAEDLGETDTYHRPIAFALQPISDTTGSGANRSTPTGNLVTDIYRAAGAATVGDESATYIGIEVTDLLDGGPVAFGPVTGADAFRMQCYGADPTLAIPAPGLWRGFPIVVWPLPGAALPDVLQFGIQTSLPQVSGVTYEFNGATRELVRQSVRVGGQPVDPSATYWITTNLYVAQQAFAMMGGDPGAKPVGSAYDVLRQGVADRVWLVPDLRARVIDVSR